LTDASALAISGAPVAGTNATITNSSALRISGGSVSGGTVTNAYGLYVDSPSGATNNYAAVFATGNVGIGSTTPSGKLTVESSSISSSLLLLQNTNTTAPTVDAMQVNLTGGTGITTSGVDGIYVNVEGADGSNNTVSGIHIDFDVVGGSSGDSFYGLLVDGASQQTNANEYGLVIESGWDRGFSVANASRIGDNTDYVELNPASNVGILFAGAARPTKQMRLTPEFANAVLTASGSATTTGTLDSDTARDSTEGWLNYYQWSSTQASLQDYTIAVKFQLPSDFSAWATSNAVQVMYTTEYTSTNANKVDVTLYNMTSSPDTPVVQSTNNVSSSAGVWSSVTIDDSILNDNTGVDLDTSDQTAVVFLKAYSMVDTTNCTGGADNGCYTRIGDVILNYLRKN
jgi:hypothetical protein